MTYLAITACAAADWAPFGKRMAETFCKWWSAEIELVVYTQDFTITDDLPILQKDLYTASPWLASWKARRTKSQRGLKPGGGYDFRLDAVKFSNKVAAIDAAMRNPPEVLIWIDADVISHGPVSAGWMDDLFSGPEPMAWLDRAKYYPETSFMMFRPAARPVIDAVVEIYRSDELFTLPETHDGVVFQRVVNALEVDVASLSGEGCKYHNAFANSPLSTEMDHLKGDRKTLGRTPKTERKIRDKSAYWK